MDKNKTEGIVKKTYKNDFITSNAPREVFFLNRASVLNKEIIADEIIEEIMTDIKISAAKRLIFALLMLTIGQSIKMLLIKIGFLLLLKI